MTQHQTPYQTTRDQAAAEQAALTDAQIDMLERAAKKTASTDEHIALLISGVLGLVAEVRRLRSTAAEQAVIAAELRAIRLAEIRTLVVDAQRRQEIHTSVPLVDIEWLLRQVEEASA